MKPYLYIFFVVYIYLLVKGTDNYNLNNTKPTAKLAIIYTHPLL